MLKVSRNGNCLIFHENFISSIIELSRHAVISILNRKIGRTTSISAGTKFHIDEQRQLDWTLRFFAEIEEKFNLYEL